MTGSYMGLWRQKLLGVRKEAKAKAMVIPTVNERLVGGTRYLRQEGKTSLGE